MLAVRAIALLLGAGAIVVLLGPPMLPRRYRGDDPARFATPSARGVVQLTGEAFLLAMVTLFGRRWFRIGL